ncbi:hypothetical protein GCM10027516_26110 [Niabella aquatica]
MLLVVVVAIYLSGMRMHKKKSISTYISLDKRDRNPYGAYVFHESLKQFFPKATFKINYSHPGDSRIFGDYASDQLYIILQPAFNPSSDEVDDLITFIDRGNNVFISTFNINQQLSRFVKASSQTKNYTLYPFGNYDSNTMQARLATPPFTGTSIYTYPGTLIEGSFNKTDSTISKVIGSADNDAPNFIHLKKGNGNLYIHLSPMALTNYFLLYGNNIQYFEKIASLFPARTPLVIWDEYFNSHQSQRRNRSWFNAIMQNPYFRAGILTALLLILMYVLTEMRRRQRVIPVIEKPKNDSLEFVKTIGLLYYERGDHTNLAHKLSTYFMEHVRNRYKIFAKDLDKNFIEALSYKSGVSVSLVKDIVTQISRINSEGVFTDTELIAFQNNIEAFYNKE